MGHERGSIWTTRDKREAASTPSGPQRTSGTRRSGIPSGHQPDAFVAIREKRTHRSVRSVCACARVCVRTSPRAPLNVCTWARVCGCVRVSSKSMFLRLRVTILEAELWWADLQHYSLPLTYNQKSWFCILIMSRGLFTQQIP